MMTILVTNTKGGCGKTTISTNLAGAFARAGYATALADADRQGAAIAWAERRDSGMPRLHLLDWSKDVTPVRKNLARLVIDAPAGLKRKVLEELVREADVIVLPVLPSVFDETATRRFLEVLDDLKPVRKGRRAVAVVANRVRPRTRAASRLERFLAAAGHPVVAKLRDSQAYVTVAEHGLSIFDLPGSRHGRVLEDWAPLLAYMEETAVATAAA